MKVIALLAVLACAGAAWADAEDDADRAFRAAEQRAIAGDPGALEALETLGAARPVTRWTDDAWLEAARLAARAGDYTRARRDLEQAIATAGDEQLARRAQAELARIAGIAGGEGQWAEVAAAHDRLATQVTADGDPKPAIAELEQLVRTHPGYPRAAMAMVTIALGWTRDGELDKAIAILREAKQVARPADRERVRAELVRALIRGGELGDARREVEELSGSVVARELGRQLRRAELRRDVRWILAAVLAGLIAAALVALRRQKGSWRAALRRLVRPPAEVLYFAPIALVLALVAHTGNPMIARAVRTIAVAGGVIAWLSGALLAGTRPTLRRALAHAALAFLAVGCAVYLTMDHDQMIDLVIDTWHEGPALR